MISIDKIETIEKDQVKINNKFFPISGTYKKIFQFAEFSAKIKMTD